MARPEARNWCWTINNPVEADAEVLRALIPLCTYVVFGEEVGEQGTKHLQGYCCFKDKKRLTAVKKLLPRAHLEIARGTPKEASDYCKKDGQFAEFGELPAERGAAGGQALALKYEDAWAKAKAGDVEGIDPSLRFRHYHTILRIRQDYQARPADLDGVCGFWYWGPPQTGKSYSARQLPGTYYCKPANKWFDGYQGEDTVILDDLDLAHRCLGYHLKIWADRYAFPAEMKGTTVQIRPKRIVVTSNYTIEQIFAGDDPLVDALRRRFAVTHFNAPLLQRQPAFRAPSPPPAAAADSDEESM